MILRSTIEKIRLNSNAIKIIAMFTMVIDHIGFIIFDNMKIFRIIGRLSFPLFAFMIAEGCRYTRNKLNYFLRIFILAVICQIFFEIFYDGETLNTLLTFSMSILLIYLFQYAKDNYNSMYWTAFFTALVLVMLICEVVPELVVSYRYKIDYRFPGVLMPLAFYIPEQKYKKLIFACFFMMWLCFIYKNHQYWCFMALIPLSLYNGKKGKLHMKYFVYLFYPLHFVLIYAISLFC
ncbi:MAG: hypothetical protein IJV39_05060 [Ruminococcus sp.]|nr:hypothetical protein [Ruminococcus sp.]